MPVSSRRCGMITRREAERLCKSFLGDNAPPRLPEDFAFTVYHKCAWGCRGSFLPSRYNSSRAKCIKCSYCGMFFSPNKFIFHSHRISTGDKYVQPDAANFNSWRRHMILSGQPPEDIVHAWEDVKAMFNGGTRKRLMSHGSSATQASIAAQRQQQQKDQLKRNMCVSTPVTTSLSTVPNESGGGTFIAAAAKNTLGPQVTSHYHYNGIELSPRCSNSNLTSSNPSPPPTKRQCDKLEHNVGALTAAAAAVVNVTAVAAAVGSVRPLNIGATSHGVSYHGRSGNVSTLQLRDNNEHEMTVMPLSRNFMMDYMWHAHAAQNAAVAAAHKNRGNNTNAGNVTVPFGFSDCAMNWLKTPSMNNNATFFTQLPLVANSGTTGGQSSDSNDFCPQLQYGGFKPNASTSTGNGLNTSKGLGGLNKFTDAKIACLPQFLSASAFKPVLQQSQQSAFDEVKAVAAASTAATLTTSSVYPSAVTENFEIATRTSQEKISSCGSTTVEMTLPTIAIPPLGATSTTNSTETKANGAVAETASKAAASLAFTVHANFCATASNGMLFGGPIPPPVPPPLSSSLSTLPNSPGAPYRAPILASTVSSQLALKKCENEVIGTSIKGFHSTDDENNNDPCDVDDDEVVDIETTEDDTPASKNLKVALSLTSCPHRDDDGKSSSEFYSINRCNNNNDKQFIESVIDTSSDESPAPASSVAAPPWTNSSASPVPRDCYRCEDQRKSPIQYFQDKSILGSADADIAACHTVVQKLQLHAQYKNSNNQPPEAGERFQQSPTYSSTSNDSFYIQAKFESNNNSSSSIEIMDTSSIQEIVQQHNAYNLGSSLMWKKLLNPEVEGTLPDCNHFNQKPCHLPIKDAICTYAYEKRLPCGHVCQLKCHVNKDPEHIEYKFYRDCDRIYDNCVEITRVRNNASKNADCVQKLSRKPALADIIPSHLCARRM
ncbi:PREDICTED: uncharacterized protein LOC108363185 [Rhagoletis zephyria]|uniref:uncharacterized protein LOC108363185 n=1 Tax=Rhagoletis zephyria TaxID=28612 RepID=UPI000811740F|nr:PREDICTED: uncharacterized protein LOC108363185 [Rhagoletis zephyria]